MNYTVIVEDGSEYGPYSVSDLNGLASEGRLQPGTKLRRSDGYLTTAGSVLSCWNRPAAPQQQQTYRPPAPVYRPSIQPLVIEQEELNYAPVGLRFGAFLIDTVIYCAVAFAWSAMIGFAAYAGNTALTNFLSSMLYIINFGIMFLCYVFLAATPGKLMLGLRIVSLDGSPPTVLQVFKRTILLWFCGFPLAFWGVFTGPEYRSIVEKFAGTATVKVN